MKKIITIFGVLMLICSCSNESSYVEKETPNKEYEILFLDDNGVVQEQKTLNEKDAKQYLEFISINFNETDTSDESQRAITPYIYTYQKLINKMEDNYTTKIVKEWVYALTQSSVWYQNGSRIYDLCFARYTLNNNGQYVIYSDFTWEQVKKFTTLYQNEVNSFEYEIHNS